MARESSEVDPHRPEGSDVGQSGFFDFITRARDHLIHVKRREPLPDLSHILEDSRPHRPIPMVPTGPGEKRIHARFDKAFVVMIGSELYGETHAIARNVSAGGILVEMCYAPPLGTVVTVHFQHFRGEGGEADLEAEAAGSIDELVVRAEVKHHHYLNFNAADSEAAASRAIGMRFLEFVDTGDLRSVDKLH